MRLLTVFIILFIISCEPCKKLLGKDECCNDVRFSSLPFDSLCNASMTSKVYYTDSISGKSWTSTHLSHFKLKVQHVDTCHYISSQIIYGNRNIKNHPDTIVFYFDTCTLENSKMIFIDSQFDDSLKVHYFSYDTINLRYPYSKKFNLNENLVKVTRFFAGKTDEFGHYLFMVYPIGIILKGSNFESNYRVDFVYNDDIKYCLERLENDLIKDSLFYHGFEE